MVDLQMNHLRILTLSKKPELKRRTKKLFSGDKAFVIWESDVRSALEHMKIKDFDVVILTSYLCSETGYNWIEMIDTISAKSPQTQIIFLVEPDDMDIAMEALKAGAYHYARLPLSDEELKLLIETALADRPQYGVNVLKEEKGGEFKLGQIIGGSLPMQKVYQLVKQAAAVDIHILLLGETGTGKDLVARTIHTLSGRRDGAYIPVNLGSLPLELVSSELFGHEKGAFTGALRKHIGVFERADKGTVFLDEIDTIDEKIRVSLLRLIEQKQFTRLGGKQRIKTDARLIVASNADLVSLVEKGTFRKDLFYRLDEFRIELPPLRDRKGDIPLLTEDFVGRFAQSFNKDIKSISPKYIEILESYDWPGNIRELKNVIQRSVLMCDDDKLKVKHLPSKFSKVKSKRPTLTFKVGTPLHEVERQMVIRALQVANNNRKRAAELLGISRRVIYNKINKFNID